MVCLVYLVAELARVELVFSRSQVDHATRVAHHVKRIGGRLGVTQVPVCQVRRI